MGLCRHSSARIPVEKNSIVDLNTLIPPGSGLVLIMATSINDSGEIGGQGVSSAGDNHAFLLVPCDDNHPGVQGCDYSMVDANPATSIAPVVRGASERTRLAAPWRRNRSQFLRSGIGPRN